MSGDLIIPEGFGNAVFKWAIVGRRLPVSVSLGYVPDDATVDPTIHADTMYAAATAAGSFAKAADMIIQYTFVGVTTTFNDGGTIVGGESTGPSVVGTQPQSNPMIISSSFIVQKRTGLVGKQFRGRAYFPKCYGGEAGVDYLGNIDSAEVGAFQGYMDAFVVALSADAHPLIMQLLHHPPKTGVAPVPTQITSLRVESNVGTQRRRLR